MLDNRLVILITRPWPSINFLWRRYDRFREAQEEEAQIGRETEEGEEEIIGQRSRRRLSLGQQLHASQQQQEQVSIRHSSSKKQHYRFFIFFVISDCHFSGEKALHDS